MRIAASSLMVCITVAAAAQAQTPSSISFSTPTTSCAQAPFGTVTLNAPAPVGGTVVQLTSSMPGGISVPASMTVPAGATSATFTGGCTPQMQSVAVTITAMAGSSSRSTVLNILAPVLKSITFKQSTPTTLDAVAALIGKAPAGGVIVTLLNSNSALASMPQSVTIPAGSTSAPFIVNIVPVAQPQTFTITGTALGVTQSVDYLIQPPMITAVKFGTATTGSVEGGGLKAAQLIFSSPAPTNGATVQLSSSDPNLAEVPPTVSIRGSASQAEVTIKTRPTAVTKTVTITATTGSVSKSAPLTVTMPAAPLISVDPFTLVGGQSVVGKVLSTHAAPAEGTVVNLTSSDPVLVRVTSSVTIPAGATSAPFRVVTSRLEESRSITITSAVGDDRKTTRITVNPEGPTSLTISPESVIGGTNATGRLAALVSNDSFSVQLSSALPDVATVPASVSFAPGDTSKTFSIATSPVSVATTVSIRGTTLFLASKTTDLLNTTDTRVTRSDSFKVIPPALIGFTMNPTIISPTGSAEGRLTLNGPAPSNYYVTVGSSDSDKTFSVLVPAGSTVGTFPFKAALSTNSSVRFYAHTATSASFSATVSVDRR